MIFEICAVVVTILLIILTVYIIQTLKGIQHSLKSSRCAIDHLSGEVTRLREDVHLLLKESTEIAEKVNVRINDLDPLLESFSSIGRILKGTAHSFETPTPAFEWRAKKKSDWQDGISNILEFASTGMKIFQQIKKRK
jgi:uncharacterized protein YoxC